jgi:hypothetical protein
MVWPRRVDRPTASAYHPPHELPDRAFLHMSLLQRPFSRWSAPIACAVASLALALFWAVREAPLEPAPAIRVDALGAFFAVALLGGMALSALSRPGPAPDRGWRRWARVALLLAAWATTLTPVVAGVYLIFALLEPRLGDRGAVEDRVRGRRNARDSILRGLRAAPGLIAAGALLAGYGALAARGALRYDARATGAALDGFVFWLVLLAATVPILDWGFWIVDWDSAKPTIHNPQSTILQPDLFAIAWLYPLARLYSLGPWNGGWALAALLLGGGAALWVAVKALFHPESRSLLALPSFLGLAIAGVGLGTGAGIAAGCYAVLAYLVVAIGDQKRDWRLEIRDLEAESLISNLQSPNSALRWLLSGALPFSAPFVAAWMLVGAGVAGGVALLAGIAWLILLLNSLCAALASGQRAFGSLRPLRVAAAASAALGLGAPLVVLVLIQPIIEQLQGGLTPYGDVNIWPWVGLAAIDAAHAPATTLPSIAVAALMLVLSALVYLVARLRDTWAPAGDTDDSAAPRMGALLPALWDEVPWLRALASRPSGEEQRVDGE